MPQIRDHHWAIPSDKEGFPGVVRRFRGLADADSIHAGNRYRTLNDAMGGSLVPAGCVFRCQTTRQALQGRGDSEAFVYPRHTRNGGRVSGGDRRVA